MSEAMPETLPRLTAFSFVQWAFGRRNLYDEEASEQCAEESPLKVCRVR